MLAGWAGALVEVAAGFMVPRLMDRHLGQTALGIWDFAWSCVSYFKLAQVGIAPATSRYLARYRAMKDVEGVRRVASSTIGVSACVATTVLALTALATWLLPRLFATRLHGQAATAQWVVAVLGIGLAFDFQCEVFSGALTGSHRWDLHVAVNAGQRVASASAMIATLLLGGGLRELALAYTGCGMAAELFRMFVAYRAFPELRIRPADFSLQQARQIVGFGGKQFFVGLAWLVMGQTNTLVVVSYLGPAALALYARPRALLRFPDLLVRRVSMVVQPTASSLQGIGRHAEIRQLLVRGVRAAAALMFPAALGLLILGGPLMRVWMGSRYDQSLVLAILVLGVTPSFTLRPARSVLTGLNLHGFVAVESTIAALVATALSVLNVAVLGLGLIGAALAVSIPQLGLGLLLPFHASRKLEMRLVDLLRDSYAVPLACAVPFSLVLLACRLLFDDRPLLAVVSGSVVGGLVLLPLYWRYLTPSHLRRLVLARLPGPLAGWLRRIAA